MSIYSTITIPESEARAYAVKAFIKQDREEMLRWAEQAVASMTLKDLEEVIENVTKDHLHNVVVLDDRTYARVEESEKDNKYHEMCKWHMCDSWFD